MRENDGREKKNGTERKANRTHSTRRNEREKNAMKNFPCKTEVIIFFQKYTTRRLNVLRFAHFALTLLLLPNLVGSSLSVFVCVFIFTFKFPIPVALLLSGAWPAFSVAATVLCLVYIYVDDCYFVSAFFSRAVCTKFASQTLKSGHREKKAITAI